MKRRSELESFVLGLVWQTGPCSAYEIRRQMRASPSSQWSASAGAIYPLIRRLERAGLVAARERATGKRRRREYRATAAGVRALKAWIGPPLAKEAVTVAHDPLRTRARFLGVLTARERRAWVRGALAALREVEKKVRAWEEEYGGLGAAGLLSRYGEMDVEMRRRWLREVSVSRSHPSQP